MTGYRWEFATLIAGALTALFLSAALAWGDEKSDILVWALPFTTDVGGQTVASGQFEFEGFDHCEAYAGYLKQKHGLYRPPKCRLATPVGPVKEM